MLHIVSVYSSLLSNQLCVAFVSFILGI